MTDAAVKLLIQKGVFTDEELWTEHFSKIGEDVGSKVIVLSLVHIIEDKAKIGTANGDWSMRILQELRRYGIPPDEFWEIQSTTQR